MPGGRNIITRRFNRVSEPQQLEGPVRDDAWGFVPGPRISASLENSPLGRQVN